MIDEKTKAEIIEILDNIIYWDSCPISYKEKIPRLVSALKPVKNIAYKPVLGTVIDFSEFEIEEPDTEGDFEIRNKGEYNFINKADAKKLVLNKYTLPTL
jgi:hypothetical protein